jgi:hypothetical protein
MASIVPKKRYTELRCAVGMAAQDENTEVAERLVSLGFVRYWRARFADPSLHANGHGGHRIENCRFSDEGQLAAESLLWTVLKAEPLQTQEQMRSLLLMDWSSVEIMEMVSKRT